MNERRGLFFIVGTLILFALAPSAGARPYLSAKRSAYDHMVQWEELLSETEPEPSARLQKTAYQARKSSQTPSLSGPTKVQAPWPSQFSLQESFEKIRNNRVLTSETPQMKRRPTWLYPDDGCFARAEIAAQELRAMNLPPPAKIFAFGDLAVATDYTPSGRAEWWYHVVVGYQFHGMWMVFDPSVNFYHPLTLKSWTELMGKDVTISICETTAVDPDSLCETQPPLQQAEAFELDTPFLDPEWSRLLELHRDPVQELGDQPPWHAIQAPKNQH